MQHAVLTFGCRVNQADSRQIEEDLLARGAAPAPADSADLVVVNTCSVTATADQQARQAIRRLARNNPCVRIVVTGCYATRRANDVAALPGVVRVVGNEGKGRLVSDLDLATAARPGSSEGACGAWLAPGLGGRTACTLCVQTGCSERCSYCIVPLTRGAARSRPIEAILAEADRIRAAGFKEVILTGVHLGSYGRDLPEPTTLVTLLRALDSQPPGDTLFRIGSLEPMDCPDEVVDLVARSGRFAPHFHLPLQHASDRILRAMRRPYTRDEYLRLVDGIRDRLPHAAIGSDVIAGFPGERPADVDATAACLESSPLTYVHVFPYSDRPGTEAAAMPRKVTAVDIRERASVVREVGRRLAERFQRDQIGQVRRALTIGDGSVAVTDNYLKVRIMPGRARNEWVSVRLTAGGNRLTGRIA